MTQKLYEKTHTSQAIDTTERLFAAHLRNQCDGQSKSCRAAQRLTAERFGERLGELLVLAQGCSELPSSPRVSGNPPLAAGYMPDPSRETISDTADDTRLPADQYAAWLATLEECVQQQTKWTCRD